MNETHPNAKEPCYDCGSTIPGHHSDLCDLTGPGDKKDLESCGNRRPGCPQAWIGTLDSNGNVKDLCYAASSLARVRGLVERLKRESLTPWSRQIADELSVAIGDSK